MTNKQFFEWIYDRMIEVHGENPNIDYMISFKTRLNGMSDVKTTILGINDETTWEEVDAFIHRNLDNAQAILIRHKN